MDLAFLNQIIPGGEFFPSWFIFPVVLIILWVILSFPAYLLLPYVRKARLAIENFTRSFSEESLTAWHACFRELSSRFNLFFSSHCFRNVHDKNRTLWKLSLKRLLEPLVGLSKEIRSGSQQIEILSKGVTSALEKLDRTNFQFPQIPEIPKTSNFVADMKPVKRAWVYFIIIGFILLLLVTVNAGMLSQILVLLDVGTFEVLGIRFYYVLAAFLTFLEVGVGIGYAFARGEEISDWSFLPRLTMLAIAFSLACMEGFFYSRVGSSDLVRLFDLSFSMEQAFFVMGFVLPLVLFYLGHAWIRSTITIREGYVLRNVYLDLKRSLSVAEVLRKSIAEIGEKLNFANQEGLKAQERIPQYMRESEQRIISQIQSLQSQLENLQKTKPEWAGNTIEPLTDAEVRQEALRVSTYLLISIVAIAISTWVQNHEIQILYPSLGVGPSVIIAIAQSLILLCLGLLLRPSGMIVEGGGIVRLVAGMSDRGIWILGLVGAIIILGYNLIILFNEAIHSGRGLPWVIIFSVGVCLVALGRELPGMVAIFIGCISSTGSILKAFAGLLLSGTLKVLWVAFLAIEFIMDLVSAPVGWLFRNAVRTETT